jgi:hypothetical protein
MATNKQAIRKLFPKEVVEELNSIVRKADGIAPKTPKGRA